MKQFGLENLYFSSKRDIIAKTAWCRAPSDPSSIFLAMTFTGIMPGSSDFMYSSYFMLENIWHHHFTWSGPNSQEIVDFVPIVGPRGPELNWNKFTISCEFGPLQEKWWCHMSSSIKMEKYMGLSVLAFFEQKWSPKIYCLGPYGPILCISGLKCVWQFWDIMH